MYDEENQVCTDEYYDEENLVCEDTAPNQSVEPETQSEPPSYVPPAVPSWAVPEPEVSITDRCMKDDGPASAQPYDGQYDGPSASATTEEQMEQDAQRTRAQQQTLDLLTRREPITPLEIEMAKEGKLPTKPYKLARPGQPLEVPVPPHMSQPTTHMPLVK